MVPSLIPIAILHPTTDGDVCIECNDSYPEGDSPVKELGPDCLEGTPPFSGVRGDEGLDGVEADRNGEPEDETLIEELVPTKEPDGEDHVGGTEEGQDSADDADRVDGCCRRVVEASVFTEERNGCRSKGGR